MSGEPRPPPTLIALSPGALDLVSGPRFVAQVARARAAGLAGLVLREPNLGDRAYFELACGVRAAFSTDPSAWLAVHDRAHLACALGADAVHVGFRSLAPQTLRTWLAPSVAIGLSTHASDDERLWDAAEYVFHGPVFDTPSKRGVVAPIGLEGLVRVTRRTSRPVWALGGVTPERARDVLASGVRGVAVRGAIFDAPDPARAVERLLAALPS
jgi:thiamine-phosphate diphosphorylase